ncbi:MAG: CoA transferase [Oscillospiraceae bacterium]
MKRAELPSFGNLNGIRVVTTGTNIAGPVAATFLAEQGAEVIHIESTKAPDMLRRMGRAWTMEHRNGDPRRSTFPTRRAKIFLKLLEADMLIEASRRDNTTSGA